MPIFAAGRVCAHSFFDLVQLYFHQHPAALQFWFELTRSDQARIWDGSESVEAANVDSLRIDLEEEEEDDGGDKEVEAGSCDCDCGGGGGGGGASKTMGCSRCHHQQKQKKSLREIVNDMRSTLDQIPVPHGFVDRRYGGLVHALLEYGIMSLGLYRPVGVGGSTLPYALINPPPDTMLVADDLLYILRPTVMPSRRH